MNECLRKEEKRRTQAEAVASRNRSNRHTHELEVKGDDNIRGGN
jgi:hypothetical protein